VLNWRFRRTFAAIIARPITLDVRKRARRARGEHAWRRHAYNLEDIAANIRPWNLFGDDLKKKNRDHSHSITTTFRGVPVCFAEGNLGAM